MLQRFLRIPKASSWLRPFSSATPAVDPKIEIEEPRKKFKNHFKRASSALHEAKRAAYFQRELLLRDFRPALEDFDPGDAIELVYAQEIADKDPSIYRGVVIRKDNKGTVDESFTLANWEDEVFWEATFKVSSPLVRKIRLLRKWHVPGNGKPPRRAKLTYIRDLKPNDVIVTSTTGMTRAEIQDMVNRRVERRLAAREAKRKEKLKKKKAKRS